MLNAALSGKLYAGNPHVRFDEKGVALEKPRHGSLLSADRIASKCLWVLGVIVGVVFGTQAARLTYVGTDGGNWTASNVYS